MKVSMELLGHGPGKTISDILGRGIRRLSPDSGRAIVAQRIISAMSWPGSIGLDQMRIGGCSLGSLRRGSPISEKKKIIWRPINFPHLFLV